MVLGLAMSSVFYFSGGVDCITAGFWVVGWFPRCGAGVLSFASPKESSQRKGDPVVDAPLRGVPCATRRAGRLAKLAAARLKHSQPKAPGPPALLSVFQGEGKGVPVSESSRETGHHDCAERMQNPRTITQLRRVHLSP